MASDGPLEIPIGGAGLIAAGMTRRGGLELRPLRLLWCYYTTPRAQGKPHGITHQSGVTFQQRLPFPVVLS